MPATLELGRELLRAAPVREARRADPLLPPHLRHQLLVHRLEDPRVAAGGEVAEYATLEAELGLRDEVEQVVGQPVVVADRSAPQVGIAVAADLHRVPLLSDPAERDLHCAVLTKNA